MGDDELTPWDVIFTLRGIVYIYNPPPLEETPRAEGDLAVADGVAQN
jgi:hypothetical protein